MESAIEHEHLRLTLFEPPAAFVSGHRPGGPRRRSTRHDPLHYWKCVKIG
ncbi:unnamed protein product [Musa banksii]